MLRRGLSPVTVCAEAEAEEDSEEASMKLYHKVGLSFVVSAFVISLLGSFWMGEDWRCISRLSAATGTAEIRLSIVGNSHPSA
jgi:hypothetical protein